MCRRHTVSHGEKHSGNRRVGPNRANGLVVDATRLILRWHRLLDTHQVLVGLLIGGYEW